MLLEFSVKNYRCFKDEIVFSMIPTIKQKDLNYSILRQKVGSKDVKALCSAIVYGSNASGKSIIINAMETLKFIILRGNINNSEQLTPNISSSRLELIPNIESNPDDTVDFKITFFESGLLFSYKLKMAVGSFMNTGFNRLIKLELLEINNKIVFERNGNELKLNENPISEYLNSHNYNSSIRDSNLFISKNSIRENELFLTNGFKNIVSNRIVDIFINWFVIKFKVIVSANIIEARDLSSPDPFNENFFLANPTLSKSLEIFGLTASKIGYLKNQNQTTIPEVVSFINDKTKYIPASYFESFGTLRFLNEFPLILDILKSGGTLVVDEFDASIHPIAFMNLIKVFHNDEVNINHAQLIFNTHNPIFLDSNLFRRDEIKFVEKASKFSSIHYSLSDIVGVRKGEDYMKNYFISKYGAINDVDFSDVIEGYIKGKDSNAAEKIV